MIRYNLRTLLKNKVLWAWPIVYFLFTLVIFAWGDITSAQNSYSFILVLGGVHISSSMFISQFVSITTLITVVGLPSHFFKNLKSERAALLLSKPISRSDFFLADFASVMILAFFYTFICIMLLAILMAVKAAIFPFQLFLGFLLFLPLLLLTYYITIVLILILTNSFLGAVFFGYFLTGFSSLFLDIKQIFRFFGIKSKLAHVAITLLSYLIPSAEGAERILNQIFSGGFTAIDGSLFVFVLVSCLPFGLLSYYLFLKKEF